MGPLSIDGGKAKMPKLNSKSAAMRAFRTEVALAWTMANAMREQSTTPLTDDAIFISHGDVAQLKILLAKGKRSSVDKITEQELLTAVADVMSDVLKHFGVKLVIDNGHMRFAKK